MSNSFKDINLGLSCEVMLYKDFRGFNCKRKIRTDYRRLTFHMIVAFLLLDSFFFTVIHLLSFILFA